MLKETILDYREIKKDFKKKQRKDDALQARRSQIEAHHKSISKKDSQKHRSKQAYWKYLLNE